jgi:hypothetical protein
MSSISEIDLMRVIDDALSKIQDNEIRVRVLKWAWAKFASNTKIESAGETPQGAISIKKINGKQKKKMKKTTKTKATHTILKGLNLKSANKKSFHDFAAEKAPSSNAEKCVVAVYYLKNTLKAEPVGKDHVFTCFKGVGWRLPSDLDNTLQWVASQKGWLDTANMSDIKVTVHGENLIEHDLPKKKESK